MLKNNRPPSGERVGESEKPQGNLQASTDRRKFLRKTAIIAGGATVGSIALYEVLRPHGEIFTPSQATLEADEVEAYAYFGPSGQITIQRDNNGNISGLTYGPLNIQVTRDLRGAVASVETSLSISLTQSIRQIDTINRNPDGSISGVTRQRPS